MITSIRVSLRLILITSFLKGMMANFNIIEYIIARENLFYPCKIDRADLSRRRSGTVRSCTVTGQVSADVYIYRRRPAPVQYVTTKDKF